MRPSYARIIWKIAACDFRLTMREKTAVIWIFLMPLGFMFFFGMVQRGGGGRPSATITIEDRDGGILAGDLVDQLKRENYHVQLSDTLPEGRSPVRTLVVPEGFTTAVLGREKVELVLRKERGSNAEAGEAATAAVFRSLARLTAGLIEIEEGVIRGGGDSLSVRGDTLFGSLLRVASGEPAMIDTIEARLDTIMAREPGISIAAETAGSGVRVPTGFQSSVPGMTVMFVLMSMLFSGTVITAERTGGVLRRFGMTPAGKAEVVLGKLGGRMLIGGMQIVVFLAIGRFVFGVDLGGDIPALAALMLTFAFCMGALSILFGTFLSDPDQVTGFAVVLSLVLAALGGCWWPLEVVSEPFRTIAFLLPTGWTMDGIHKLISFGKSAGAVVPHMTVLLLFGLVFAAVGAARLKLER